MQYKPKLSLEMVHKAVDVLLDKIQNTYNESLFASYDESISAYSKAWGEANKELVSRGMEHVGHIAMPTYTSTPHQVDCNIAPDDPLYETMVSDAGLMEKYYKIYMFFFKQLKKGEYRYWHNSYPSFYIDAFKTLLAGHYLAIHIRWRWHELKNRYPYKKFLQIIEEIDAHESFLENMEAYLVANNKQGSKYNNPAFALAVKYFIDEILCVNELKKKNPKKMQMVTNFTKIGINFNIVFNALVRAEKYHGKTRNNVLRSFINNLCGYVVKFPKQSFDATFNSICQIGLDNYSPYKNCLKPHQKYPHNANANINNKNFPNYARQPN